MVDFGKEYYLLNHFPTVGSGSVFLIYVGRFNPENPKATVFQRSLVGVLCWIFFDLLITEAGKDRPAGPNGDDRPGRKNEKRLNEISAKIQ